MHALLIIAKDLASRKFLETRLQRRQFKTIGACNAFEAKELLRTHTFHYCICDATLLLLENQALLHYVQTHYSNLPIGILATPSEIEPLQTLFTSSDFPLLEKPLSAANLKAFIEEKLIPQLSEEPMQKMNIPLQEIALQLVGPSLVIQNLNHLIKKLSTNLAPIYISGPSGVGKERVARLIHQMGPRAHHPFIPVNCGAIPRELMESEFFGYKKGSFTGATQDKIGLFQAADQGTLFLDEIAELPLEMQVKLLRAIQEKAVRPLGSSTEIPVNVRILSATNKDLKTLVAKKQFREDLFYRIHVIELKVPSLKERKEDLPHLIDHILSQLAQNANLPKPSISKESVALLTRYEFPGNVRELENILERAFVLCANQCITPLDLQFLHDVSCTTTEPSPSLPTFDSTWTLTSYLETIEKEILLTTLKKCQGDVRLTAKSLGIPLPFLNQRLQELEVTCALE